MVVDEGQRRGGGVALVKLAPESPLDPALFQQVLGKVVGVFVDGELFLRLDLDPVLPSLRCNERVSPPTRDVSCPFSRQRVGA